MNVRQEGKVDTRHTPCVSGDIGQVLFPTDDYKGLPY